MSTNDITNNVHVNSFKQKVQSVFRTAKTNNFVQIDKALLYDKKLSLRAKGLLCIMLSMFDNWEFHITHLITLSNESEYAVRQTLNELRNNGYLERFPEREGQRIVKWVTVVYETPDPNRIKASSTIRFSTSRDSTCRESNPTKNKRTTNNNFVTTTATDVVAKIKSTLPKHVVVADDVIVGWLDKHPESYILDKITLLTHKSGLNNPTGWLVMAIERDFTAPAPKAAPQPASYEIWSPELQAGRNAAAEQAADTHDWREELLAKGMPNNLVLPKTLAASVAAVANRMRG